MGLASQLPLPGSAVCCEALRVRRTPAWEGAAWLTPASLPASLPTRHQRPSPGVLVFITKVWAERQLSPPVKG